MHGLYQLERTTLWEDAGEKPEPHGFQLKAQTEQTLGLPSLLTQSSLEKTQLEEAPLSWFVPPKAVVHGVPSLPVFCRFGAGRALATGTGSGSTMACGPASHH